jgi:hypothetical protein
MVWYGMVCRVMVWYGMVWYVVLCRVMVWYGMVWYGGPVTSVILSVLPEGGAVHVYLGRAAENISLDVEIFPVFKVRSLIFIVVLYFPSYIPIWAATTGNLCVYLYTNLDGDTANISLDVEISPVFKVGQGLL